MPVQIIDRPVEVVREVKVVQEVVREVQIKTRPRNSVEWAELLDDLAERLDDGRIYDRSLEDVAYHVDEVVRALNRRLKARR